ncbi:MAG: hypothetical protein CMD06_03850, partial [Flavobacteriales bacterium]|nr:hypothetical protein [Flavobacteriales bacterium]
MKRFILFLSIFFYAIISSNELKAQADPEITSAIVTQLINCPGDEATVTVTTGGNNIGNGYRVIIFVQGNNGWNWVATANTPPTTLLFGNGNNINGQGLFSGNYMAVLSDPSYNPTGGTTNFSSPLVEDTVPFSVFPAIPLFVNSNSVSDNLCFGDCIASQQVTINGGQNPYTITLSIGGVAGAPTPLSPNVGDTTYSSLCADSYEATITDVNGCTASTTFTISVPDTLLPVDPQGPGNDSTSITCQGANDGTLTVNPGGGTPPYTYSWSDGQTTQTASNLGPGCYTVLITDANGCDTLSELLCLSEPNDLTVSAVQTAQISCNSVCDGEITASVVDSGVGPIFQYTLINVTNNLTGQPQGSPVFSNLCAGDYQVILADANDCKDTSSTITINEPAPITFNLDTISYVGGFGFSCKDSCDGEITINNFAGGNGPPYFFGSGSGALGSPQLNNDTILSSLCATGANTTFTFVIEDALGCQGTNSITLTEPIALEIDFWNQTSPISCPGICDGEISVVAFGGGILIDYYLDNNYFASDIPGNSVTTGQIVCGINTNQGPGTIVAINANGCTDTNSYFLSEPALFDLDLDSINENCNSDNGQVSASLSGGTPPYTYSWTGPAGWVAGPNIVTGPIFLGADTISQLTRGWYFLTVTDDFGCFITDSIFVDTAYIDVSELAI